jgi:hypothetical protein
MVFDARELSKIMLIRAFVVNQSFGTRSAWRTSRPKEQIDIRIGILSAFESFSRLDQSIEVKDGGFLRGMSRSSLFGIRKSSESGITQSKEQGRKVLLVGGDAMFANQQSPPPVIGEAVFEDAEDPGMIDGKISLT